MSPPTIPLHGLQLNVTAYPLTPEAFSPFGEVIQNPRPNLHPAGFSNVTLTPPLPFDAVSANQGSAIKYQHVTRMVNRYPEAPSGVPGVAVMNMFVCATRKLQSSSNNPQYPGRSGTATTTAPSSSSSLFAVNILERHPYTTQTFTPLSTTGPNGTHGQQQSGYLVIVAPSLASTTTATASPSSIVISRPPDLSGLKAFIATPDQAVTYGAGTWHAPMVALGPEASTVDFVVTQFANGVGKEDCEEVAFGSLGDGSIYVQIPTTSSPSRPIISKL